MSGFSAEHVSAQTGRRFLVTGANAGIGFEVARILAARGAAVVRSITSVLLPLPA